RVAEPAAAADGAGRMAFQGITATQPAPSAELYRSGATRSRRCICDTSLEEYHLLCCQQYPTGTCGAGNGAVRSSQDKVSSVGNSANECQVRRFEPHPRGRQAFGRTAPGHDTVRGRGDCQHQGGRGLGSGGRVNPGETLLNAVLENKRKLLTRLGQKGTWSGP